MMNSKLDMRALIYKIRQLEEENERLRKELEAKRED